MNYTPIRMAKIQNTDNAKCRWGCGANKNHHLLLVRIQNSTDTVEDSLAFTYTTKHILAI